MAYASQHTQTDKCGAGRQQARLAQSVERLALNQVVVGSSPTVGASFCAFLLFAPIRKLDRSNATNNLKRIST